MIFTKKHLETLNKTFVEDSNISIKEVEVNDQGETKPVVKYKNKGFLSPSKMLTYKASQIYENAGMSFEKYQVAIQKGKDYHRLFHFVNQGYIPKTLSPKKKAFIKAISTFYKKYQLTPIVGEFVLWSTHNYTMCIADCIAVDKDENWVVIELKTMENIDLKKELLSHFQSYVAQDILRHKLKVDNIKAYTIKWSDRQEELVVKENKLALSPLINHFQNIINTEEAWTQEIEKLRTLQDSQSQAQSLLQKLKERVK